MSIKKYKLNLKIVFTRLHNDYLKNQVDRLKIYDFLFSIALQRRLIILKKMLVNNNEIKNLFQNLYYLNKTNYYTGLVI